MTVAFPVKGKFKQAAQPLLVDPAHVFVVAVTSRVSVHEGIGLRHKADIFGVNIPQHRIVINHTVFHSLVAFYRKVLIVADVIHQIMVVITTYHPGQMGIHQRVHIAQIIIPSVKHIDVVQTVTVCTQFPEPVFQKIFQFFRL